MVYKNFSGDNPLMNQITETQILNIGFDIIQ